MKKITLSLKLNLLILFVGLGAFLNAKAQTFEYKDPGTTHIIYDLSIPPGSNSIAYATTSEFTTNSEGSIIKTTDGGETWQQVYPASGTGPSFEKIHFVNENKGFAVGYDLFLKTEDGGATWTELTVGTDVILYNNLSFYDENIGFASAQLDNNDAFAVYLTTDGGASWTTASDVIDAGGIEIAYGDENTLYSVGADELISKSTDGGDTWNEIFSGMIQNFFVSTFFKDANNGIVSSEEGTLKTTHDGGVTWSDFTTGYHFFFGLAYTGEQMLAAGTDEDVYFSADDGENWEVLFNGTGFNQLNEIALFEDGTGLICGSGGIMIKFSDVLLGNNESLVTDLQIISFYDSISEIFTVQSNTENISQLKIYNLSGQLVESFKNNSKTFSTNISEYKSGIYVVKVTGITRSSNLKFLKI